MEKRNFYLKSTKMDTLEIVLFHFLNTHPLTLKKESLSWLRTTFSLLVEAPLKQKFFIKSRLKEYDPWVEKITNRKGHFAEMVKLGVNGVLNKITLSGVTTKLGGMGSFLF